MAIIVLAATSGAGGCGKKGADRPCDCPVPAAPAAAAAADGGAAAPAPAVVPPGPGVAAPDPAAAAAKPPTEQEVRDFLAQEYEPQLRRLERLYGLSDWNAYTLGKKDFYTASEDAEILLRRLHSDKAVFARIQAMRESPEVKDPQLKRQLDLIYLAFVENQVAPDLMAKIVETASKLRERFNNFRGTYRGEQKSDNELKEILRTTSSSEDAQAAWEALKQVGPQVAEDLVTLVELRNEAARQVGYDNYYALQMAIGEQTTEQIADLFGRVAALTDEAFGRMKAELDAERAAKFGVEVSALRPWHYGDPFFQQTPGGAAVDRDALWKGRDIEKMSRDYFAGLGLDVTAIYERSDLYEREGKSQHAFCFHIDRSGDIRILLNLKDDSHWADTTLHELGHAVYDDGVDRQLPYLLRGPAHTLTTEGIAMMFGGMTSHPRWLQEVIGLTADPARDEALRKERVRDWLIFARWAMVMTEFERGLYADPRQDLDKLWWDTVGRLQGMVKPEGRVAPDWSTKVHVVSAPVYYHNYLLGELFSAQLRERLGKDLLETPRVGDVILLPKAEIGAWLRTHVFAPGKTLRWDAFVERVTGRPLGPEAFAAQME